MAKPTGPLEPRFWSKVAKTTEQDCWYWKASIDVNGYGQFLVNRGQLGRKTTSMAKAHRIAWLLTHGEIPPGMYLCHKCDLPRCVNPSHLFLGTQSDNMRDCVEKDRHGCGRVGQPIYYDITRIRQIIGAYKNGATHTEITKRHEISSSYLLRILKRHKIPLRGSETAGRKLTDTEIRQIRELYAMGNITQQILAERFGVTQSNIGYLVRGSSWSEHGGPLKTTRAKQKLTEAHVKEIRTLWAAGMNQLELAERFGVHNSTINYNIHRRVIR